MPLATVANLVANRQLSKSSVMPPHEIAWTLVSAPAIGNAASAVVPAPTNPLMIHVLTSYVVTLSCIAAPAATQLTFQILDGATVLWEELVAISAVAVQSIRLVSSDVCIVGTANSTMTAVVSAGVANVLQCVSIGGYDIIN